MIIHSDLEHLSTNDLATLLSVTDRAIQKWAKEGLPHHFEGKDLRFQWKAALDWYVQNKHRGPVAMAKGSATPSKADSEAKLLEIRARREAMRLAKEDGTLINRAAVEDTFVQVAEITRNRVLVLASQARSELPHLTEEDERTIHRLCREALQELSQCPQTKV